MYHNRNGNGTGDRLEFPQFWENTVVDERNLPDEDEQTGRLRLRGDISRAPKGVTLRGIDVQIPGGNIKEFLVATFTEAKGEIQVRPGLSLNLQPLNLNLLRGDEPRSTGLGKCCPCQVVEAAVTRPSWAKLSASSTA